MFCINVTISSTRIRHALEEGDIELQMNIWAILIFLKEGS